MEEVLLWQRKMQDELAFWRLELNAWNHLFLEIGNKEPNRKVQDELEPIISWL